MRFTESLKRIIGMTWRARMRDLERRMDKVEGAQTAFRQFAQDARR